MRTWPRGWLRVILDASAVLALLFGEPGAEIVIASAQGAKLSSVNAIEVFEKIARRGVPMDQFVANLAKLEIEVVPFDLEDARIAAELKALPQCKGLSLADRSCLAVAKRHASPVLTADRIWGGLDLDIDVRLIR